MRREFSYHSFRRSFFLPQTVDKDGISAKYDNGILIVAVPKKTEIVMESKSRMIEVG
jgi:HSP20 family protein